MIELNDRIANLKQKVAEETARVANLQAPSDNKVHQELVARKFASQTEVAVAQQKAEALRNALVKYDEDFDKYTALQKEYARLAREAGVAKEIHGMLAKRVEEAKIAEVMQQNNVQIVNEHGIRATTRISEIIYSEDESGQLYTPTFSAWE